MLRLRREPSIKIKTPNLTLLYLQIDDEELQDEPLQIRYVL